MTCSHRRYHHTAADHACDLASRLVNARCMFGRCSTHPDSVQTTDPEMSSAFRSAQWGSCSIGCMGMLAKFHHMWQRTAQPMVLEPAMQHRSLGLQGTADRQSPLRLEGLALPCLKPCLASMAKLSSASPESLGRPSARCQLVLNVASKSPVLFVCMSNCIAVVCSQWPGIAFSRS